MALFAQGEEGIFLLQMLNGNFEQKEVLRFPPVYGSSSFELVDLNNDGFPDIIYTCGDNADYSRVLKPYHGVYIFLNDGKNNFTQKYFYHIDGCYKQLPAILTATAILILLPFLFLQIININRKKVLYIWKIKAIFTFNRILCRKDHWDVGF